MLEKALVICEEYRKKYFRMPRGYMAWFDATASEALIIDEHNERMAESFHCQTCFVCKNYNPEPVKFKPESEMTDGEKFLLEVYRSEKKDVRKIKLRMKAKDGAYYFLCEECLEYA